METAGSSETSATTCEKTMWNAKFIEVLRPYVYLHLSLRLTFNNSTFCPHTVFVCFVWIWEQTAIISLYSINWLVFIIGTVCLIRGTDWIFNYYLCVLYGSQNKQRLFPYTALTDWVYNRDGLFTARYGLDF